MGASVPSAVRSIRALWKGLRVVAEKIGYVQSQIILALVYFVVLAPFALAVRLFVDPLRLHRALSWRWFSDDERPAPTLDWVRRQY